LLWALGASGVTAFSLERMPRIARAQAMDVLSSQSSISGYKAAIIGADSIRKLFPMLMTAAGTIAPTKVLVLGAGVAGLAAIATARRLGATVQANDIRPAAKEQVESLGATFISSQFAETTEAQCGYATELGEQAQQRKRGGVEAQHESRILGYREQAIRERENVVAVRRREKIADRLAGGG
jgi:proton-translocating NAD(P)+ transhydrogenase subunit alpha